MHVMTTLVKLKIPFTNMFLITLIVITNETVKISNVSSSNGRRQLSSFHGLPLLSFRITFLP